MKRILLAMALVASSAFVCWEYRKPADTLPTPVTEVLEHRWPDPVPEPVGPPVIAVPVPVQMGSPAPAKRVLSHPRKPRPHIIYKAPEPPAVVIQPVPEEALPPICAEALICAFRKSF